MSSRDKNKKSSHRKTSDDSSRSSHKKSSSSSHRQSTSRLSRNAPPATTSDENEREYDDPQYSREEYEENYDEGEYNRDDHSPDTMQRPSATAWPQASYNQSEQTWNQTQQAATRSIGLQHGATYENAQDSANLPRPRTYSASQNPQPSASAYGSVSTNAPRTSYDQSTNTNQPSRRSRATEEAYSAYGIQFASGQQSAPGATTPRSAAAAATTGQLPYWEQAAGMVAGSWQDMQPGSWDNAPAEQKAIEDDVNRIKNEDDDTGS